MQASENGARVVGFSVVPSLGRLTFESKNTCEIATQWVGPIDRRSEIMRIFDGTFRIDYRGPTTTTILALNQKPPYCERALQSLVSNWFFQKQEYLSLSRSRTGYLRIRATGMHLLSGIDAAATISSSSNVVRIFLEHPPFQVERHRWVFSRARTECGREATRSRRWVVVQPIAIVCQRNFMAENAPHTEL